MIQTLFAHLTDTGVIAVRGDTAMEFLQRQLTCDMREITPHKTHLAAYCNRQGRIQTSCRVYCIDEHMYLLSLPKDQITTTIQTLNKYGRFSHITIEDVSLTWVCYGIISDDKTIPIPFNSFPDQIDDCYLIDNTLITKVLSHKSIMRYEILAKTDSNLLTQLNTLPKTELAIWCYHDIRAGIAIIDFAGANHFLPHHINYHLIDAINVKKGCYLGQEIITRMHHLGKLKQQGYYLTLPCDTDQLTIHNYDRIVALEKPDQTIGHVINGVYYEGHYHLFCHSSR